MSSRPKHTPPIPFYSLIVKGIFAFLIHLPPLKSVSYILFPILLFFFYFASVVRKLVILHYYHFGFHHYYLLYIFYIVPFYEVYSNTTMS